MESPETGPAMKKCDLYIFFALCLVAACSNSTNVSSDAENPGIEESSSSVEPDTTEMTPNDTKIPPFYYFWSKKHQKKYNKTH